MITSSLLILAMVVDVWLCVFKFWMHARSLSVVQCGTVKCATRMSLFYESLLQVQVVVLYTMVDIEVSL